MMTIEVVNSSLLFGGVNQYLEEYKKGSCTILSNNFIQINNLSTQEVFKQCGPLSEEKVMNYIFASGKSIIFLSLNGIGKAFDDNLFKFRDSISTIKMKNTSDIKQFT